MKNKDQFSQAELDHARNYMNEVRRLAGMEPMQMDAMGKGKDGDLFEDPAAVKEAALATARRQAAYDFYEKNNPKMSPDDIKSHLNGIDFSKPVEIVKVSPAGSGPKGNELYQYTKVNTEGKTLRGKYYTDNPNATPSELGVSDKYSVNDANWQKTDQVRPVTQEKITFEETNPVEGLRSTSAPIKDNWSLKNQDVQTEGGANQIYIPR